VIRMVPEEWADPFSKDQSHPPEDPVPIEGQQLGPMKLKNDYSCSFMS
jgi:hypothetical protein